MSRILMIAWKETVQLRRDHLTMGIMAVLPLVQLLLFGYAINTDVRHLRTVVFDQDRTASSRELTASLQATGFYDVISHVQSYEEVTRSFRTGTARVAFVFQPGFSADLRSPAHSAEMQLIVDGSDPQTVASATNTANALASERSIRLLSSRLGGSLSARPPLGIQTSTWYNQDLRTAVYIVPGLTGVILSLTMVMLTAMAICRERERGTLEQLIVSPIRRSELMLGKLLPYVAVGIAQTTMVLLAAAWVFRVPINGSVPLLYAISFIFIGANLALGLFLSTIAKTQQQAMQMSILFLLPNVLLSGFMFPFEAMPIVTQYIGEVLPLTHFLRVVRRIVLKGASFEDVQREVLAMVVILGVLMSASSLRFSKKLG